MSAISRVAYLSWAAIALVGLFWVAANARAAEVEKSRSAVVLDMTGAIGPATSQYVEQGLVAARERGAEVIILRMNTPGGLDASMREIVAGILASPVPVVSFVGPRGARAASAGTYILYASHVAAMAPATNLGAATPVQLGGAPQPLPEDGGQPGRRDQADGESGDGGSEEPRGQIGDAHTAKAVNDAAAYIRGLAELRGRNAEWAERAVRQAASLSANEALKLNVIDLMAEDIDALLAMLDGREVTVGDDQRTLRTANAEVQRIEPDWRTEVLSILTDPNVAFILMMIGVYGLIFELANPGAIVPGVIGAISLMIGLYALNVLPVNYAGLALILLGVALMVGEAFVPAFGVLGIGGLIAFALGAIILFDTDVPAFSLSWPVIIGVTATTGAFLLLVVAYAIRSHRRPVATGKEHLVGSYGKVETWSAARGFVRVGGESWQAVGGVAFEPGQSVRVIDLQGLTLVVEPGETAKAGHPS
jgi:membrane-bound serine protease (ClpP class)